MSLRLVTLLDIELEKAKCFYNEKYSYYIAIDLIRQLDVFFLSDKDPIIEERYKHGWYQPISLLMKGCAVKTNPLVAVTHQDNKFFSDSILQAHGQIEVVKRLISLQKASVLNINEINPNLFKIQYTHAHTDVEHYERESAAFVNELSFEVIKQKYEKHIEAFPEIQKKISETLHNPAGQFISYSTTDEIDEYYRKLGYYYLINVQGYDDFGEDDIFGGLPYKLYLNVLQDIMGLAQKHRDYCMALLQSNPSVDPYNLLTYTWHEDDTINSFALYHGVSTNQMAKVFNCLTLSLDNIDNYSSDIGNPPPPYLKLGKNQLTRSLSGCLSGGLQFLKKELKRRFRDDYFKTVNNREARFRRDIYTLFQGTDFVTIDKEVIIKVDDDSTDIDAIVYDKRTRTLGLFQLKWQDSFTTSVKERYSRITNLFSKSVEWIDKVERWLESNPNSQIIQKLGLNNIDKGVLHVKDINLFVISRNHMFFTGQELDERAAWCSWPQLLYSKSRFHFHGNDPITELHCCIKADEPSVRIKREGYPKLKSYKFEFGDFSVEYDGA